MQLFNEDYNWYKGNLHTHTNKSDGLLSPDKVISLYKKAGYDFISITDHNIYNEGTEQEEFTILSGIELHINDYKSRKALHIVGIDIDGDIDVPAQPTPQDLVDAVTEQDGLAILAHPAWSLLTHSDAMDLRDYIGIEVFNTVSATKSNRGNSSEFIDTIASKGCIKLLFAVDDTHFYSDDLFGGYIMVNSPSLNTKDIINNIKKGNFYASQGPEIKQIIVDGNKLYVETSPVVQISFMSDNFFDEKRVVKNEDSSLICNTTYTCSEKDSIVRIECMDAEGKKAWSQFIVIESK